MNETGAGETIAVVDNWILQLACEAIEFGLVGDDEEFRIRTVSGYDVDIGEVFEPLSPADLTWKSFTKAHIDALLRVLDVIVLYDKIVHEDARSFVWEDSYAAASLARVLEPVEVAEETLFTFDDVLADVMTIEGRKPDDYFYPINILYQDTGRTMLHHFEPFVEGPGDGMIEHGALFYLSLAMHLGASYWPAPRRAEYLKQHVYEEAGTNFLLYFRKSVDASMRSLVKELNRKYRLGKAKFRFPGFGSAILANCGSPLEILDAAITLRDSKEGKKFRAWIASMESALESRNMSRIAAELNGFEDLLEDLRADLGLDKRGQIEAEIEIGLSPSITLGSSKITQVFDRVTPKARHLLFIRKHFERSLAAADVDAQINRLFPRLGENQFSFFHRRFPGIG